MPVAGAAKHATRGAFAGILGVKPPFDPLKTELLAGFRLQMSPCDLVNVLNKIYNLKSLNGQTAAHHGSGR
jgi:hypothetical protein